MRAGDTAGDGALSAWYNETDPFAAAWLRQLIEAGQIAPGIVDERDIRDVAPDELMGYGQCHFFAGIGVWPYALRRAGWPDDHPVWTGSCPCQPFSAAGKGAGFADERHLWPAWFWLIAECRPDTIFGEQVSSKDGLAWFDLVSADLEGAGYAAGALDTCAAGVGAPHIRQRLYWVAEPEDQRHERSGSAWRRRDGLADIGAIAGLADNAEPGREPWRRDAEPGIGRGAAWLEPRRLRDAGGLAYRLGAGLEGHSGDGGEGDQPGRVGADAARSVAEGGGAGGLGHAPSQWAQDQRIGDGQAGEWTAQQLSPLAGTTGRTSSGDAAARSGVNASGRTGSLGVEHGADDPGPVNGLWRDADWLLCRDGKWRPVEPGTFPLAHGAPARVGRLRGYGNALNAEQAAAFIESYLR